MEEITKNAFRILGLSGIATQREITEAARKQRHYAALRSVTDVGITAWDLPWLGPIPRSKNDVSQAEFRLSEPESRLNERLFWFDGGEYDIGQITRENVMLTWRNLSPPEALTLHNAALLRLLAGFTLDAQFSDAERWSHAIEKWNELSLSSQYRAGFALIEKQGGFDKPARSDEVDGAIVATVEKIARRLLGSTSTECVARNVRVFAVLKQASIQQNLLTKLQEEITLTLLDDFTRMCTGIRGELLRLVIHKPGHARRNYTACRAAIKRVNQEVKPQLESIQRLAGGGSLATREAREEAAELLHVIATGLTWSDEFINALNLLETARTLASGTAKAVELDNAYEAIKDSARQQREEQEELQRAPAVMKSDQVFDVAVTTSQVVIPGMCACCFGLATEKQEVSWSWEEYSGATRCRRTISLHFPVCRACKDHQDEYYRRTSWLVILSVGASLALMLVLGYASSISTVAFVALGVAAGMAAVAVLGRHMTLSPIDDRHASRGAFVSIVERRTQAVIFRFGHPVYARMFADLNGAKVAKQSCSKPTRGTSLVSGLSARSTFGWTAVLCLVGSLILHSAIGSPETPGISRGSVRPSYSPTTPSSTWEPSTVSQAAPQETRSIVLPVRSEPDSNRLAHEALLYSLSQRIDQAKRDLSPYEARLELLEKQANELESELDRYKKRLESTKSSLDTQAKTNAYNRVVDAHNAVLGQLRTAVAAYNSCVEEYKRKMAAVNALVDQYNSLLGDDQ